LESVLEPGDRGRGERPTVEAVPVCGEHQDERAKGAVDGDCAPLNEDFVGSHGGQDHGYV
jgi:hypothetical protein